MLVLLLGFGCGGNPPPPTSQQVKTFQGLGIYNFTVRKHPGVQGYTAASFAAQLTGAAGVLTNDVDGKTGTLDYKTKVDFNLSGAVGDFEGAYAADDYKRCTQLEAIYLVDHYNGPWIKVVEEITGDIAGYGAPGSASMVIEKEASGGLFAHELGHNVGRTDRGGTETVNNVTYDPIMEHMPSNPRELLNRAEAKAFANP